MYKVENHLSRSSQKGNDKIKVGGRKYQFRAAHGAMQQPELMQPGRYPVIDARPIIFESLFVYFDNLVAAATKDKLVREDFVDNLTTLTTSNADMAEKIKKNLDIIVSFSNNSTVFRRSCLQMICVELRDANRWLVAITFLS